MKTRHLVILAVFAVLALTMTSCTLSVTPDGKPQVGVDPVALANAINNQLAKSDSKDATVIIVAPNGPDAPQIVDPIHGPNYGTLTPTPAQ